MKHSKKIGLTLVLLCALMCGSLSSCKWFKSGGDKKMSITLGFSMPDILRSLSHNPTDSMLNKALLEAELLQEKDSADFVLLFESVWNKTSPNGRLASVFSVLGKQQMSFNASNSEVIQQLNKAVDDIIDGSIKVIETRLSKLGCEVVSIQKAKNRNRFTLELADVADPQQVMKLLQYDGKLEFWETYDYKDVYSYLEIADKKAKALMDLSDSNASKVTDKGEESDMKGSDRDNGKKSYAAYYAEHPLMAILQPALLQDEKGNYFPQRGPVVGYCQIADTAQLNKLLRIPQIAQVFPPELHFAWSQQPLEKYKPILSLIALKAKREGKPALDVADKIIDARQDFGYNSQIEITIKMNAEGAKIWRDVTANNIGKAIAMVLDDYVYSYPTVQGEIPNGNSSITGNFTESEAKDLATILKAGRLPARIIIMAVEARDKDGNLMK